MPVSDTGEFATMRFFIGGPRLFGHRTGVIFSPEDLRRLSRSNTGTQERRPSAFAYVIRKSISGHVKVGVGADPRERLRNLQTGSSEQLELVYACAVKSNDANRVERAAHDIMWQKHLIGEWFDYTPEIAVAAIAAASHKLGDPIVEIPIDRIGTVLEIAARQDAAVQPRRRTIMGDTIRTAAFIFGASVIFAVLFVIMLNH
jgi:Meiotically up-regulated gene 113